MSMETVTYWSNERERLGYETTWSIWEVPGLDTKVLTDRPRLVTYKIYATDASVERIRNRKSVYPAYQSIEIAINEPPPGIVMIDFESRIYKFAEQNDIQILGIRIEK